MPNWLRLSLIGLNGVLTALSIIANDWSLALFNAGCAALLIVGAMLGEEGE